MVKTSGHDTKGDNLVTGEGISTVITVCRSPSPVATGLNETSDSSCGREVEHTPGDHEVVGSFFAGSFVAFYPLCNVPLNIFRRCNFVVVFVKVQLVAKQAQ